MTEGILRQATAVAINGRALLLEGPPGCGKSTLALSLIDRGARLIGDDGVRLTLQDNRLIASAPPNTAGLFEVRNVGLVQMPPTSACVSLVLRLVQDAPRYIEQADRTVIAGQAVPLLYFARSGDADPIRAELALERHGLPIAAHTVR